MRNKYRGFLCAMALGVVGKKKNDLILPTAGVRALFGIERDLQTHRLSSGVITDLAKWGRG